MLQINSFKTTKLTSCILDLKCRHTARIHVTPRISEILRRIQMVHMYAQNNACTVNNYPHLLDKKLSTCHRKCFCLRTSVKYLQQSTLSANIAYKFTFRYLHMTYDVSSLGQSESRTNII